jgi:hypothetical protein
MPKLTTFLLAFFLCIGAGRLQAQNMQNTAWKFYVDALNDTLTMHIGADTSRVTSSSGELIVRSIYQFNKDTIKMKDIDGQYPCPDGVGVYQFKIDGDIMTFTLVNDPCDNRSNSLRGVKFKKAQ